MRYAVVLLLTLAGGYCYCQEETTTVESPQGRFKGYIRLFESFGNKYRVRRFLGIPYAEPPTGSRRFKKPAKKAAHTGVLDATARGAACHQLEIHMGGKRNDKLHVNFSEDCLFLNIFTPDVPVSTHKLPVMIFIHGGGFNVGFSDYSVGDTLSVYGDVVVVTLNYRLNIWGFLSTGDKHLPGNYGLWDQQMAINWVHDNIASFGGDPELVTLFGHSAGAASVIYQSMFPGNKGLFKRIIALSGSITCPWAYNENPLISARKYGALLGCIQDDTGSLSKCIASKSTAELHNALNNNNGFNTFPLDFISVIDNEFVPLPPKEIFHGTSEVAEERRQLFADIEFMTGVVSEEGLLMINPWAGLTNDTEKFRLDRALLEAKYVPDIARIMFGTKYSDAVKNLLVAEYTDWSNPDDEKNSMSSFLKISADYTFNIQAVETLRLHTQTSKTRTYAYIIDAFPSQHILWTPTWATKPNHGDELTFIFGHDSENGFTSWTEPFGEGPPADWEYRLSKAIMTMWTNFAKSGDPNTPTPLKPLIGTDWPIYVKDTEEYLNMSSNDMYSTGQRLFARSYNYWMEALPRVISDISQAATIQSTHGLFCDKEDSCAP
ncbi:liver carboxylesterase 1F-like [Mercenaria mercenaria]|uniref:liver carboxylesterase 1F-like n=1 Tax=Mercenaria mercenaria TaxID=6596 RepID=UPI00234E7E4A|nr:liver carboxylesterase 1F-like [Mercenaria mercenaria]